MTKVTHFKTSRPDPGFSKVAIVRLTKPQEKWPLAKSVDLLYAPWLILMRLPWSKTRHRFSAIRCKQSKHRSRGCSIRNLLYSAVGE